MSKRFRDVVLFGRSAKKANVIVSPVFRRFAEMIDDLGWEQARINAEAKYTNLKTLQTSLSNIVKIYVREIARIPDDWMARFRAILTEGGADATSSAIFDGHDAKDIRHQIYKLFKMLENRNIPKDLDQFHLPRGVSAKLNKLGSPFKDAVLFGATKGYVADTVNAINKSREPVLTGDSWLSTDFAINKAFRRIRQFADVDGDISDTWKLKLIFLLAMSGRRQEDMFDDTMRYSRTEDGIDWFIQDHPSKQKGLTNTPIEFPVMTGREVFQSVLDEVQPYLMENYRSASEFNKVFNDVVKRVFIDDDQLSTASLARKKTGHNLRSLYLQAATRIVPHPSERDVVFGARILGDTVNVVGNRYAGVSRPSLQIF